MDGASTGTIYLFAGFQFAPAKGSLGRVNSPGVADPSMLGSRANSLLALLVERQGELVTKDEIFAGVWPGMTVEEANLTVQISALRRVLDQHRRGASCIQTLPGRGYRFVAPVTRVLPRSMPEADLPPVNDAADLADEGGKPEKCAGIEQVRQEFYDVPSATRYTLRRTRIAAVVGALCLASAVIALLHWRLLLPREDHWAPRLSIVVLPFVNLSNDPEQQYFADALTEDITADLSRIPDMLVISRSTAFTYKDKPVNAKQIGSELSIRYVLEGSVRRSGGSVRVSIRLVDAQTDAYLWAERFDGDTGGLFAINNEITSRIAIALDTELVRAEVARPTEHPDALDYTLRARALGMRPPTRVNSLEQIRMFERALALDPRSVEVQSRLALTLSDRVLNRMTDTPTQDIARAEQLVEKALAASPRYPLAHFAKGQIFQWHGRCTEAILEFETVIGSDPNATFARTSLGLCKLLTGSLEETIPLLEQAIRLSPRDAKIGIWYYWLGLVRLLQSRTDEAIRWLEKARIDDPDEPYPHAYLASAYGLAGEAERAAAELAEARELFGDGSFSSIRRLRAVGGFGAPGNWGVPQIQALFENTFFVGLRKAGVPEK